MTDENKKQLVDVLEEMGIEQSRIDEVMNHFIDNIALASYPIFTYEDKVEALKKEMDSIDKSDWRKRAALAAKIVSLDL